MTRSPAEGLQYRVRVEFVLRLPPGAEPPTPTREAVDAVALCVSGPPYGVVGDPVVEVTEVAGATLDSSANSSANQILVAIYTWAHRASSRDFVYLAKARSVVRDLIQDLWTRVAICDELLRVADVRRMAPLDLTVLAASYPARGGLSHWEGFRDRVRDRLTRDVGPDRAAAFLEQFS